MGENDQCLKMYSKKYSTTIPSSSTGITIRMAIDSLRVMGRATQGVKLINLREGDSIASVCVVPKSEDEAPKAEDGTSAEAGQSAESANE